MDVETDNDRTRRMRMLAPAPITTKSAGSMQIKLVFMIVAIVTLVWVGVLFYIGSEIVRRSFD